MASPSIQLATFGAGCFWGVEHIFCKHFGNGRGIEATRVGFSGGKTERPTYRSVCGSNTQHAEAVQIAFDPTKVSYESLVEFFFRIHDPTQLNRQGPDVGTQYRSVIFTHTQEQQQVAERVCTRMQQDFWKNAPIVTEIQPIRNWWDAEDYHQLYLVNNPGGYECPTHFYRASPVA